MDEVNAAMGQPRYSQNMEQTMQWIDKLTIERQISPQVRIVNTGIIHYKNISKIKPLLDEICQTVWELGQPECQILWAALAQPYENLLQRVEWEQLNPQWLAPK
jgi:hypothetical protein